MYSNNDGTRTLFESIPVIEVGQTLEANGDNGQVAHVVVTAVNEDSVTIDGNHPLAGKELVFDIEVVSIQ